MEEIKKHFEVLGEACDESEGHQRRYIDAIVGRKKPD